MKLNFFFVWKLLAQRAEKANVLKTFYTVLVITTQAINNSHQSFILTFILNIDAYFGYSCTYHHEDKEQKRGVPHPHNMTNDDIIVSMPVTGQLE
jgi:hypothetical protein